MQAPRSSQPQLHLASASPRRRELLAQVGVAAIVLPQDLDESLKPAETAADYVCRLAREKAAAALRDAAYRPPLPVLAADTAVVCNGRVLGKPADAAEAQAMLRLLSGRTHQVMTAVAVAAEGRMEHVLVTSAVSFRTLADAEIAAYWASGEPRDKAGAYGIQGLGAMFVSRVEGSYSGVVGLPLYETVQLLAGFGIGPIDLLNNQVRGAAA